MQILLIEDDATLGAYIQKALRQQGHIVDHQVDGRAGLIKRSEEHTSELQSLMRISYAVFCLKKKKIHNNTTHNTHNVYQRHSVTINHESNSIIKRLSKY